MKKTDNLVYSKSGCELDVYLPDKAGFKTLINFHGGGLVSGSRKDACCTEAAAYLAERGYCVVQVDYRMYPNAAFPDFITDAADAVKYVKEHVSAWGGNGEIYVTGQSAGAYLSLMLCVNPAYLGELGVDPKSVSGWIIDSAQTTAHFRVLQERGYDARLQRIDETAPLFYLDEKTDFTKLMLIFYTDDMPCRYEQNMLFYKTVMNFNKNAKAEYRVLEGVHVQGSTKKVNGVYPVADIIAEYMEA